MLNFVAFFFSYCIYCKCMLYLYLERKKKNIKLKKKKEMLAHIRYQSVYQVKYRLNRENGRKNLTSFTEN